MKHENEWQPLPQVDKNCFACGGENPHGLQMRFESNGEELRSQFVLEGRFRGWSNLIHGGIISTILDETMSWTAIYFTQKYILTAGMSVEFRRPIRVGMTLVAHGRIVERIDGGKAVVAADIRDDQGRVYASSEGKFALFSKSRFLRMGIIPEEDLELMAALISK